jgi:N-acyl homoserine lactone hydrolase
MLNLIWAYLPAYEERAGSTARPGSARPRGRPFARVRVTGRKVTDGNCRTRGVVCPSFVGTAILSHLHQDHIGGLPELTGTSLLVSAAEWAELSKRPEPHGFLTGHIQLPGLNWHKFRTEAAHDPSLAPFTESLDVMGDGSLVLLPTPGHTAGSVSLLVRRAGKPPLLLAGDLTYAASILQHGQLPGVGSRRQLTDSTRKVLALAQQLPGLVVLPAHDPTAAQRLLDS